MNKHTKLTLVVIGLAALIITACGGSKKASEAPAKPDPRKTLTTALEAAKTPGEKSEAYTKAIAEAVAAAAMAKGEAEAKQAAFDKAPGFSKKAL